MPTVPPTLSDRDTFLEQLRIADILTPRQYEKAAGLAPNGASNEVAATLVSAGLITRFQADRILAGRTDGFVLGQHVVLDQIGRGTMSRVYRAKHRTMNRPVAIKVLASELTRTAADRENFHREIRNAGRLAHPNIVAVYDASELNDRFYFVLEYVDGPNLKEYVSERGPLPLADACEFIRQAAAGLRHAHELGMIHHDIKPQNLLVVRPTPQASLTVKIADFGIPKAIHGPTDFAAPEQSSGESVDARADLYSLGAVFYFLLTGKPAREGLPLRNCRDDVPEAVEGIVNRLLARRPEGRFASAAELGMQLDTACVPLAIPVEGKISFDLPELPLYASNDSGYLGGRPSQSSDIHAAMMAEKLTSPWARLIEEQTGGEAAPQSPEEALPRKGHTNRNRESVPAWMTAFLLIGIVLLVLMSTGAVVNLLAK